MDSPTTPAAEPRKVKALEMFPEFGDEVDRRIEHSETRIKNWVATGVVANLVALFVMAIPLTYSLGQIQAKFDAVLVTSQDTAKRLKDMDTWRRDREVWETSVESYLATQGFRPIRVGKPKES